MSVSFACLRQAAMFFAALGKEKKLLALAKADTGFVGERHISGAEGDISSLSGQGDSKFEQGRRERRRKGADKGPSENMSQNVASVAFDKVRAAC